LGKLLWIVRPAAGAGTIAGAERRYDAGRPSGGGVELRLLVAPVRPRPWRFGQTFSISRQSVRDCRSRSERIYRNGARSGRGYFCAHDDETRSAQQPRLDVVSHLGAAETWLLAGAGAATVTSGLHARVGGAGEEPPGASSSSDHR